MCATLIDVDRLNGATTYENEVICFGKPMYIYACVWNEFRFGLHCSLNGGWHKKKLMLGNDLGRQPVKCGVWYLLTVSVI